MEKEKKKKKSIPISLSEGRGKKGARAQRRPARYPVIGNYRKGKKKRGKGGGDFLSSCLRVEGKEATLRRN